MERWIKLQKRLERRAEELRAWLEENGRECVQEQRHLCDGSDEQVHWHFGYLAALQDVLAQLKNEQTPVQTEPGSAGIADECRRVGLGEAAGPGLQRCDRAGTASETRPPEKWHKRI